MATKRPLEPRNDISEVPAKKCPEVFSSTPTAEPGPSCLSKLSTVSAIESPSAAYFTCSSSTLSTSVSYSEVFDSVKGPSELPDSVSVLKFAECRANELALLNEEIKRKKPKLALQQLPKHMRRRAASHNANRIPRRLREKALKEIEKAKKPKRQSRKHRRRPSNLLTEYTRRQRNNIWLETHIWFAKRFKMAKMWGYVLPLHPNDKSFRAAYKALTRHVLIQDLSYLCCIQLEGPESLLLSKLSQLVNSSTGLTFAAKAYLSGTREGTVVLYDPGKFPYHALGPVSFFWEPLFNQNTRKLWIWCHPLMHDNLVEVLKKLFEFDTKHAQNIKSVSDNMVDVTGEILDKKLSVRIKPLNSYIRDGVSLTLLKDTLVRHRLIGPLSHSVILDALKPASLHCNSSIIGDAKWWEKYYKQNENENILKLQKNFWAKVQQRKSPNDMPPKIILGLTVKDPRLDLPKTRRNISYELTDLKTIDSGIPASLDPEISHSPLWDETIRDVVTSTKIPESKLNELRSEILVPGTRLELGREEACIPIIVIQQPGHDGFLSGWDVIAPLGWSMPFWIAFIYRGARAFGLRELRGMSKEVGIPIFPYNFPDTTCGVDQAESHRKLMLTKHFRFPPSRRPSFIKLGIQTPFYMPWEILVTDWVKKLQKLPNDLSPFLGYFVLRTKKELNQLFNICQFLLSEKKSNREFQTIKTYLDEFQTRLNGTSLQYALVCVTFKCLNKGSPSEFSGVYLPHDCDILKIKDNKNYVGPKEPIHDIPKSQKLKQKKKSSSKLSVKETNEDLRLIRPTIDKLIDHCRYPLMGYIETGNYSFIHGCGTALGYCSLIALVEVLLKCFRAKSSPVVFIRSQDSLQYRVATINVVKDFI